MRRILIDCKEHIPCNPCQFACPTHAIVVGEDITELPHADPEKCVGCGACVAACPGQACFLIDPDFSESEATIDFPYEYLPLPPVGLEVEARNNLGGDPVHRAGGQGPLPHRLRPHQSGAHGRPQGPGPAGPGHEALAGIRAAGFSSDGLPQAPRRVPPSADGGRESRSCFPAACTSENTPLRPQVCERQRVHAAACIPSKKRSAFLRSAPVGAGALSFCASGPKACGLPRALFVYSCV